MSTHADDELPREELQRRVDEVGFWWHSLPLSDEIITPGHKTPEVIEQEWQNLGITDLTGKSVLDIGAWDGYFSFRAEAMGAARVVAMDHYMWGHDRSIHLAQKEREIAAGLPITRREDIPASWGHYDTVPGRRGFDLAHEVFDSRVEPLVADFMTCDLDTVGEFDVVFFLGVLYHLENPMEAMRRVARLTTEMAIVETHAIALRDLEGTPMWEFAGYDEMGGDPTNWWAPNHRALVDMCRAAGFSRVVTTQGPPGDPSTLPNAVNPWRLTVQAFK